MRTRAQREEQKEKEANREVLRTELKGSLFLFVKFFWDTIISEEPIYNFHIPYLCAEIEKVYRRVFARLPKEYDLIINIPPGTSKSTICTIMAPVWGWINDPTLRYITASYSAELSTDHALKSRDIIRSPQFKDLFPEIVLKADKDNKTNYDNTFGGSRSITSPSGTSTGKHAHILTIDDGQNPKKAASEVERKTTIAWNDATLATRKIDKKITVSIWISQRLHEEDLTGHMLTKDKPIRHLCLPAELSDRVSPPEIREKYTDGLLDPVRLDRAILAECKTDLGSYDYAGQFEQNPAPSEGGILKKAWFEIVTWEQFRAISNNRVTWNFLIDGAYTKKNENDPCGFLAYCVSHYTIYIRDARCLYLEQPELINTLNDYVYEMGYTGDSIAKMEPKANGISTVQMIQRTTPINFREYRYPKFARANMQDSKETRVRAASPPCEAGRVKLIRGLWNQEFIDQCAAFPNAKHDEYPDLLQMAVLETVLEIKPRKIRRY